MYDISNIPYAFWAESDDPTTSPGRVLKIVPRSHHRKILSLVHNLYDKLSDVSIFAVRLIVYDNITWRGCSCTPAVNIVHSALRNLQAAYKTRRKQNRKNGFTVPAPGLPLRENPARKNDQRISQIVRQLHDASFCEVAVFWQSSSDGPCHFRVASLPIGDALEELLQFFNNALESVSANVSQRPQ